MRFMPDIRRLTRACCHAACVHARSEQSTPAQRHHLPLSLITATPPICGWLLYVWAVLPAWCLCMWVSKVSRFAANRSTNVSEL